jgi:hypothetical protein
VHKSVASQLTMLMDRLQTIESFVRIAHAGSYTKAAQQLGVSRALLSRRIIELEARLGVRLLNRSTRSVSLTTEGRAYLTRCKQVLEDMDSADREIARSAQTPLGGIRVLAPKSFGVTCLSDAMIAFSKMHKQVRISLSLGDFSFRPADFDRHSRFKCAGPAHNYVQIAAVREPGFYRPTRGAGERCRTTKLFLPSPSRLG